MIYAVIGLAILLVIHFIVMELKFSPLKAFMSKGLASFGFIMIFGVSLIEKGILILIPFAVLILLGLVSGLLGDLYLALRTLRPKDENFKIINSGILCFSIGHLFYLGALLILSPVSYFAFLISFIMTAVVIVGSRVLKFEMNISRYPSYFYSILIFFMIGQSLGYAIMQSFSIHSVLLFIGAILFGISDLILAPIYFKNDNRKIMIAFNLSTYYLAQILIALSVYYL